MLVHTQRERERGILTVLIKRSLMHIPNKNGRQTSESVKRLSLALLSPTGREEAHKITCAFQKVSHAH